MSFQVRFTEDAEDAENDLIRLYEFILNKEEPDWTLAARAIDAIKGAILALENSAFSHRKASPGNPFLSELIIPFGASGYVALFEIEDDKTVIILALRLQREEDYH